jgi:hypothetical protein
MWLGLENIEIKYLDNLIKNSLLNNKIISLHPAFKTKKDAIKFGYSNFELLKIDKKR